MMVSTTALYKILDSELNDLGYPGASSHWLSHKHFAASKLRECFLKKFMDSEVVPEIPASKAIHDFKKSMDRAKGWRLDTSYPLMDVLHGEVRNLLWKFWNVPHPFWGFSPLIDSIQDVWPHMRPGPGASIDAEGNDFYTKLFASPLSSTSVQLTAWYKRVVSCNPLWEEAENFRSSSHGASDRVVRGSRLSVVPKNNETGRCICTEPSINMLFQLGIGMILEKRLRKTYGLGFDTQPLKNQDLARMGSRSGNYATIDLKSASDSISLGLLKSILPDGFLNILQSCRSSAVEMPDGSFLDLPVISTMGNGYTFPLQTIVFTCILHASYILHDIPLIRGRNANFGVFGDDIICDTRVVRTLYRALEMYGFIVNEEKSFFEGPFRESCGADFLHGFNVRPFYLKRLRTMQDIYVAINRLSRWSALTGVSLPRTTRYLLARCKWLPVPRWESDDAGIKVPYAMVEKRLKLDRFTFSPLYRYFSIKPQSIKAEGFVENSAGALVALLAGSIRDGVIVRRQRRRNYILRWNCAPGWDCSSDPAEDLRWDLGQRWNTAVALNLYG